MKRWGDRRAAVELTERRELLRASEGDGWFLLLILRDAAIRQNVVDYVAKLKSATPMLNAAIEQRKLSVVGAIEIIPMRRPELSPQAKDTERSGKRGLEFELS